MEIFTAEPDGRPREAKKLCARRNYVAIVPYDPETVGGGGGGYSPQGHGKSAGRLSLAVDFLVQGDSVAGQVPGAGGQGPVQQSAVSKYGPVIVPSLEFGR